jgi:hypothetical protein
MNEQYFDTAVLELLNNLWRLGTEYRNRVIILFRVGNLSPAIFGEESIPGTESGIDQPDLHRLVGRYDKHIPTWFLSPMAGLKLPTQAT